ERQLRLGCSAADRLSCKARANLTFSHGIFQLAHQYFGRCDTAHSLACSIGLRGGKTARSFLTLGNASILSRHRDEKAGYFGYIALPSSVRPNAKVLGNK